MELVTEIIGVATCGESDDESGPLELAQNFPGYCSCAGQNVPPGWVWDNKRYCTAIGWMAKYPIANLDLCPNRINRYRPPADGCGSRKSRTNWVPQRYLGAYNASSKLT